MHRITPCNGHTQPESWNFTRVSPGLWNADGGQHTLTVKAGRDDIRLNGPDSLGLNYASQPPQPPQPQITEEAAWCQWCPECYLQKQAVRAGACSCSLRLPHPALPLHPSLGLCASQGARCPHKELRQLPGHPGVPRGGRDGELPLSLCQVLLPSARTH